ncbi:MAG TPA: FtsX-like permease family protein [Actinomycetaceae bacterium]|nr:FtsX-like permease family protein [Actinomycetaceae bacterium]
MIGLTWSMFAAHRSTYRGVHAVIMFASTILCATAATFMAANNRDGLPDGWMGSTLVEQQQARAMIDGATSFLSSTLILTALVMVFMTASTMSFAVGERRTELALLRLSGASVGQTRRIIVREALLLAIIGSLIGVVLGAILATPLLWTLQSFGFAPIGLSVAFRPEVLLISFLVAVATSLIGAWATTLGLSRINPVEAVTGTGTTRKPMNLARWIAGLLGIAAVAGLLMVPVTRGDFQTTTLGITFLGVLAIAALAPVIVPALARFIGIITTGALPAVGMLAAAHARHATRRTAALATPILLLMGIAGGLFMIAQTSLTLSQARYSADLTADIVLENGPLTAAQQSTAEHVAGVASINTLTTSAGWSSGDDDSENVWVSWINPATITDAIAIDVIDGDLTTLDNTTVATTSENAQIGDTIELADPDGTPIPVTVGAVIRSNSLIRAEIIAAPSFAPAWQQDVVENHTWISASPETTPERLTQELNTATPGIDAITKTEWLHQGTANWQAQQIRGIVAMLGAAILLTVFAMALTALSSVRERKTELDLLRSIGTTQGQIRITVLIETVIIIATAGFLTTAVLAIAYMRLSAMLAHMNASITPTIPIPTLTALFAVAGAVAVTASQLGVGARLARPRTLAKA